MLNSTPNARLAALALVAIALAGCNKQADVPAEVPAATPTAETPAEAPAPTYPADYKIDAPVAKKDVATSLALASAPSYRAKDDMLFFDVEVTNSGKVPLVSNGSAPVRVAITLAGPEGVDKAPGVRGFARAKLPLTVPGAKGVAHAAVPAEKLLGLTVRAELVQEGVAWFSKGYHQPTIDVGVFQRCNGAAGTLCDAAGAPLATHP